MPVTDRVIIAIAAVYGFLAVGLGAFGAHYLKSRISEKMLNVYQTGVQYQFYHALALLMLGVLLHKEGGLSPVYLGRSAYLFTAGVLLFSGSLYILALGGPRWLGPVTPLGGVCLLLAWATLLFAALQK